VLLDEKGFSLISPLKRTWAPVGQTPRIRTSLNHHDRLNLTGALVISPKGQRLSVRVRSTTDSQTGNTVLAFLRGLLADIWGPIVLVWDSAPIHTRHKVRDFIAAQMRLHVFFLPKYAPELNPVEFLWAQLSEHLACRAPQSIKELKGLVHMALQRSRASRWRLEACLCGADLPWGRRASGYLFKHQ
jgi:putative transposase